ncbi:MAG TPA: DUF4340 domain-containing protein [Cyclobacteriaceae bacterium]|nr:DUF4340 domain-containing protein [Cyclobacteriaceae bacterium]
MITLSGLILISFGLAWFSADEPGQRLDREYFRIPDTEKIDKVILRSPKGEIQLGYEGSRWHVNDSLDADVQMIKVLFATLKQIEPRRPVAAVRRDSVIRKLADNGIEVTLFESGEKQMTFLVGGNDGKTETWFKKDADPQPYVMMIPGYRVYVAGIFELDESGWRDKRIFNFNWRNFRSLKVIFPKESRSDFEIEMKGTYFGIKSLPNVDTARLNNFLDALSLLYADRYNTEDKIMVDSLLKLPPLVQFKINDAANRSYSLDILPSRLKDREVYGRLANGEVVAFGKQKTREIVRRKEYFLPGK